MRAAIVAIREINSKDFLQRKLFIIDIKVSKSFIVDFCGWLLLFFGSKKYNLVVFKDQLICFCTGINGFNADLNYA